MYSVFRRLTLLVSVEERIVQLSARRAGPTGAPSPQISISSFYPVHHNTVSTPFLECNARLTHLVSLKFYQHAAPRPNQSSIRGELSCLMRADSHSTTCTLHRSRRKSSRARCSEPNEALEARGVDVQLCLCPVCLSPECFHSSGKPLLVVGHTRGPIC